MTGPAKTSPKRVIFCFNTGRIRRLGSDTPDDFFYGFRRCMRRYPKALLVEPHYETQGLVDHTGTVYPLPRILRKLPPILGRNKLNGLTRLLQAVFAGRRLFDETDAIIAVTNTWIYAFSLLKRFGLLKCPVIGVAIGPYNPATDLRGAIRNRIKRFLFRHIHLVFLGDADQASFHANILATPLSSRVEYFGIDDAFWHPDETTETEPNGRDPVVFAIGAAGRDYPTLLQAWHRSDARLKIVTHLLPADGTYPEGVEVVHGIWHDSALSDTDIRALFQSAQVVVCPLFESTQPCGQSATLQAMACGKAIVLTRTAGLWDPLHMRHDENCLLVPPGDANALRLAIDSLLAAPDKAVRLGKNARQAVIDHYSADQFANALIDIVEQVSP